METVIVETDEASPIPGCDHAKAPTIRWHRHVIALTLVLIGVGLLGDPADSWTMDDGAYALQVEVLDATGDWEYPYRHLDIDPGLDHLPFTHGTTTDDGTAYPYSKLPAWIVVLRASTWAFGDIAGLRIPSLIGVLAAALAAWRLARRFDPVAGPVAFWAVGVGVLLVEGTAMWAHTVAAALAAVCAGHLLDAADGRRARPLTLAAVLAGLCLIRNEGLFVAAATLAVLGVLGLKRGGSLASRAAVMVSSLGPPLVAVVVAALGSRAWSAQLVEGSPTTTDAIDPHPVTGEGARIVHGAIRSLVDGAGDSAEGTILAVLALVLVGAAGVTLARRDVPVTVVLAGTGLGLLIVRSVVVAPYDLAGFAAASPLLVLAAAAAPWRRFGPGPRALGAAMALFSLAVLATQYPEGGSRDWGGRFFLPLVVPAVVGAVVSLRRTIARLGSGRDRRAVIAACGALVVVPTLLGLRATGELRELYGGVTDKALAADADVVVRLPPALGRVSWRAMPESDWMTADSDSIENLLVALRDAEAGSVAVVGPGAEAAVTPTGYSRRVEARGVVVFTPAS